MYIEIALPKSLGDYGGIILKTVITLGSYDEDSLEKERGIAGDP